MAYGCVQNMSQCNEKLCTRIRRGKALERPYRGSPVEAGYRASASSEQVEEGKREKFDGYRICTVTKALLVRG